MLTMCKKLQKLQVNLTICPAGAGPRPRSPPCSPCMLAVSFEHVRKKILFAACCGSYRATEHTVHARHCMAPYHTNRPTGSQHKITPRMGNPTTDTLTTATTTPSQPPSMSRISLGPYQNHRTNEHKRSSIPSEGLIPKACCTVERCL